jgi:hypothetical protein
MLDYKPVVNCGSHRDCFFVQNRQCRALSQYIKTRNKNKRYDITEIVLEVALDTNKQTNKQTNSIVRDKTIIKRTCSGKWWM